MTTINSVQLDASLTNTAVNHGPETAGQYLVSKIPTAKGNDTVGTVLAELAGERYDSVHAVYVISEDKKLRGMVSLPHLLAAGMQHRMNEVMSTHVPKIAVDEDQEQVAAMAIAFGVAEVPVVDAAQQLLGVVPTQALLRIQRREHIEDMNRLVGIWKNSEQARTAIEGATIRRVMNRLPWLFVGLLGSSIATWIMASFEDALEARLAIAFFIPAIVYLADAIGTQTEAIAVRGLSFSESTLKQLVAGELWTGVLIGITLAVFIFPSVYFSFGDARLALVVSLSVIVAGAFASTIGLLFPWLLAQLGKDPAYGSGPVATIVQDVLSLLTYFIFVVLLMK